MVTVSLTVVEEAFKSKRKSWSLGLHSPLAKRTAHYPDMAKHTLTGHGQWKNTLDTWFYADLEALFEKLGHFVDIKQVKGANIIWHV